MSLSPGHDEALESLVRSAQRGDRSAMEEVAKRRFISEHDFALAYSGWNRAEELRWLEKAYASRAGLLVYLRVDSVWDDLRADPAFQGIVRKIGIPE